MEQRDLLRDEIEQISKVIAQIVANLLGLKSKGSIMQGIEITNEQLKTELNIDIEALLQLDKTALQAYLAEQNITYHHYEALASYLKEAGLSKMTHQPTKAITYLSKSLELLILVDEISSSISFERSNEQSAIAKCLKDLQNTL